MQREWSCRSWAVLIAIAVSVTVANSVLAQSHRLVPWPARVPVLFAADPADAVSRDSTAANAPTDSAATPTAADSSGAEIAIAKPGLGGRIRRAAVNFGSDAWIVTSSPFRLRGRGLLLTAAVLGAEAAIYANDQEILDAVLRNREQPVLKQTINVGTSIAPVGFMGRTNAIYMATLGAGYAFDVPVLRSIPTQILESHFIAGGVRNIGKLLVGRQHPSDGQGPYAFKFAHGTSFPSGHTSVVYELATIASMNTHSLPVAIVSYALATSVAIQRVESLNHWPSDVFIAATYGTLVARTVVKQHQQRERGRMRGMQVLPDFDTRGELVGVRLSRTF